MKRSLNEASMTEDQENQNYRANTLLDDSLTGEEMPISKRLRSKQMFASIRDNELVNNQGHPINIQNQGTNHSNES
jgi:hypothetical protein